MSSNGTDTTFDSPETDNPIDFLPPFVVFLVLFLLCLPIIFYMMYRLRRYKQLLKSSSQAPFAKNQHFSEPFNGVSVIPYNSTIKDDTTSYFSSVKSLRFNHVNSPPTPIDETPHIVPLDGQLAKKENEFSVDHITEIAPYRSQVSTKNWDSENILSSLNFQQIRVENWLSENSEMKCGVGEVDLGVPTPCLVKILKGEFCHKPYAGDDVTAMSNVLSYQSCDHPNLVRFYGSCLFQDSLYIVSEFVSSTNLRNLLISSRTLDHSAVISTLSGAQLMNFSAGIAEGLTYLHGNDVVHGGLCSQNVLINERLVPKLHECCGENSNRLRIKSQRWSAPEISITQVYSDTADIWSFGVLLWEIISLGGTPFADVSENKVTAYVRRQLHTGASLLPLTRNTSKRLWMLLQSCWSNDPTQRPGIREINQKLKRMKEASNAITVARPPGYQFFPTESL